MYICYVINQREIPNISSSTASEYQTSASEQDNSSLHHIMALSESM